MSCSRPACFRRAGSSPRPLARLSIAFRLLVGRVLAVALLAAPLLAGCQPPPRPFAADASTERINLLMEAPDSAGIVVEAIEGLPPALGEELRTAVVGSLQDARILASRGPGNRGSYHLRGYGSGVAAGPGDGRSAAPSSAGTPVRAYITWQLTDPEGRERASFTSTPELHPGAVAESSARALDNIARRVAEGLRDSRIAAAHTAGGPADEPVRTSLIVSVLPVEGAPGDGRESLTQALNVILRTNGVRVARDIDADGLLVYGDVTVTPAPPNRERIDLRWRVGWADGREVGRVSQSNEIQAGLVRRRWGQIALAAAEGAAAGIIALVREAEASVDAARSAPAPARPAPSAPSSAQPGAPAVPPAASAPASVTPPRAAPGNWNQVYSTSAR